MMLKNKTILILSPQAWGKMFLSKHHYAIELAKRGNTVYFLNPPDQKKTNRKTAIEIRPSEIQSDLFLIDHRLFFPYALKFKAISIFYWLMKFHIKSLLKKTGPVDIIWSFDLGNLYPLSFFGEKPLKIFHPVDEPLTNEAVNAAKGADIIFSVTHEILDKYKNYKAPRHFINHGVTEDFISKRDGYVPSYPLRVGISGNLLRPEIDRDVLLQIIIKNPTVHFSFWGSYLQSDTNIGGTADQSIELFIQKLKNKSNVKLYGSISSKDLAGAIQDMDGFLICYDVQRDQSKGTNYHKIMEYVASGKVIISNNITTYKDEPDLVQMVTERNTNEKLPELFRKIMDSINEYNSTELRNKRIRFAANNTYPSQLDRIESLLSR